MGNIAKNNIAKNTPLLGQEMNNWPSNLTLQCHPIQAQDPVIHNLIEIQFALQFLKGNTLYNAKSIFFGENWFLILLFYEKIYLLII